jgi:transcriptional regulator with XRE-family HTH domain
MGRAKGTELSATARRMNLEQLSRLGGELKASRKRRRLRQIDVATRAGLTQGSISRIERGHGGNFSLDSWQLVCLAVGRRLEFRLPADALQEPADAGHLAIQELVLRLGRAAGFARTFELPTRPADAARSADVGLRDDRRRLLVLVECWNTIGDVGAAARSSDRKRAEAEQLAVAIGPLREDDTVEPHRVRACWVVRATARNRALVARYPEVFATRFPGSSAAWAAAFNAATEPPAQPGLVWCDVVARRVFPWRHRQ